MYKKLQLEACRVQRALLVALNHHACLRGACVEIFSLPPPLPQMTQDRLKEELGMRRTELDKIDTLEDKIQLELNQLAEKSEQLRTNMEQFSNVGLGFRGLGLRAEGLAWSNVGWLVGGGPVCVQGSRAPTCTLWTSRQPVERGLGLGLGLGWGLGKFGFRLSPS